MCTCRFGGCASWQVVQSWRQNGRKGSQILETTVLTDSLTAHSTVVPSRLQAVFCRRSLRLHSTAVKTDVERKKAAALPLRPPFPVKRTGYTSDVTLINLSMSMHYWNTGVKTVGNNPLYTYVDIPYLHCICDQFNGRIQSFKKV